MGVTHGVASLNTPAKKWSISYAEWRDQKISRTQPLIFLPGGFQPVTIPRIMPVGKTRRKSGRAQRRPKLRSKVRTKQPRRKSPSPRLARVLKPLPATSPEPIITVTVASPVTAPIPERERASYDGDTAIKLYLREIGQVKLLTPQEEIELAARIKKGDKKAREQMIKANLRLVVKIARDYEGIGLPLLDLISEGNIGLMKAVERFDPAKGGKLSTYGSWWIKQSIKRALANQSKTIRLPVHLVDKISKMRRTAMRLQEELGREPTDDEVAGEMGMPTSRTELVTGGQRLHIYQDYLDALAKASLPTEPFETYLEAFRYGMPPHGGFAIGSERLLMQLLSLSNLRLTTLFPRDMTRLTP
jgi:RNA polymerase sigma factor (sigma-70 family)